MKYIHIIQCYINYTDYINVIYVIEWVYIKEWVYHIIHNIVNISAVF